MKPNRVERVTLSHGLPYDYAEGPKCESCGHALQIRVQTDGDGQLVESPPLPCVRCSPRKGPGGRPFRTLPRV